MLREEYKIAKYEDRKNFITIIMIISFALFLGALGISYYMGMNALFYTAEKNAFRASFIPSAIMNVCYVGWGLFVARLILCAICDHIIELCYINMKSDGTRGY